MRFPLLFPAYTKGLDQPSFVASTVSELLHEKRALSPDRALRRSKLLSTSPESWLKMQQKLDIWEQERQGDYEKVKSNGF